MISEVLSRAKLLCKESEEALLSLYCSDAVNYVTKYCRLELLPAGLYGITAQIAVHMLKNADNVGIASLREGERQISYSNANDGLKLFEGRLKPFINRRGKVPSEVETWTE